MEEFDSGLVQGKTSPSKGDDRMSQPMAIQVSVTKTQDFPPQY
jgi:hypothetical protein